MRELFWILFCGRRLLRSGMIGYGEGKVNRTIGHLHICIYLNLLEFICRSSFMFNRVLVFKNTKKKTKIKNFFFWVGGIAAWILLDFWVKEGQMQSTPFRNHSNASSLDFLQLAAAGLIRRPLIRHRKFGRRAFWAKNLEKNKKILLNCEIIHLNSLNSITFGPSYLHSLVSI